MTLDQTELRAQHDSLQLDFFNATQKITELTAASNTLQQQVADLDREKWEAQEEVQQKGEELRILTLDHTELRAQHEQKIEELRKITLTNTELMTQKEEMQTSLIKALQTITDLNDRMAKMELQVQRVGVLEAQKTMMESQVNDLNRQCASWRGQYHDTVERLLPLQVIPSQNAEARLPHNQSLDLLTEFDSVSAVGAGSSAWCVIEARVADAESAIEDSHVALSTQSAPAGGRNACLVPTALLLREGGAIEAKDLSEGTELLNCNGEKVIVEASQLLPGDRMRDFVEIQIEDGGVFKATRDHRVEACADGHEIFAACLGELREGMFLKTNSNQGRVQITSVLDKPNMTESVVEFSLVDSNATVALVIGTIAISIFGAPKTRIAYHTNLLKGSYDCVEMGSNISKKAKTEPWEPGFCKGGQVLVSSQGFPASQGSIGHPTCAGACTFFQRGGCKFGILCNDCHVIGCSKGRIRSNKRGIQRRLRSKASASLANSNCT